MFKHTIKVLASLFILAGLTLFISCQEEPTLVTPDGGQKNLSKVTSFVMPPGASFVSASLKIYTYSTTEPNNIDIHNITKQNWNCPISWNSFNGDYDPTVITSFDGAGGGWKTIDITATVQAWLYGDPNNGLLLKKQIVEAGITNFWSNEYLADPNLRPYLEIVTTGGPVEVEPFIDTYIYERDPDLSFCSVDHLTVAYVIFDNTLWEKQTLIRFDIEPTGGCTLTPGYWKTHSEFGPAPYDDTWAQLPNGASTPFYLSGKTYYEVLTTSPAGNAYYILSFQYIAAELNKLNGADFSAAQTAFNTATTLFQTYTPAQIGALRGSSPLRQQFVALGTILDNYNRGIIGPGHCDD